MTIQNNYFNLHVSGLGYVSNIREVPVKRGENFWACNLSALYGAQEEIQFTNFDCRVSGSVAELYIKKLQKADNEKRKILIGFKLSDLHTDIFTYEQGSKKGQTGVSLKARLFFIAWIKVDGETVYKAPPSEKQPSQATHEDHSLVA